MVTSKDEFRTKKILSRFSIKAKIVQCPEKGLRGKPYPDQLNVAVKKVGIKKMHSIYVGDTRYDKKAAKAAKTKYFIAASTEILLSLFNATQAIKDNERSSIPRYIVNK